MDQQKAKPEKLIQLTPQVFQSATTYSQPQRIIAHCPLVHETNAVLAAEHNRVIVQLAPPCGETNCHTISRSHTSSPHPIQNDSVRLPVPAEYSPAYLLEYFAQSIRPAANSNRYRPLKTEYPNCLNPRAILFAAHAAAHVQFAFSVN